MASHLLPLPLGFVAAMDVLSDLPASAVTHLVDAALSRLAGDATQTSVHSVYVSLADAADSAGPAASEVQLDSAVSALAHVYRAAASEAGASEDDKSWWSCLDTFLTPGGAVSTAIRTAWEARGEAAVASAAPHHCAAPSFAGLSWEIAAVTARWNARESDAVDKVDMTVRPFVTICVRTTHGGSSSATAAMARGSGDAHRMEMSVPQFKELRAAVRNAHQAMMPLAA